MAAMDRACAQRFVGLIAGRHTVTGDDLDVGAQLAVTDPGGAETFRAALARHYRIDPGDPEFIWIRPVTGGEPSPGPGGGYVFSLSLARRRGLAFTAADRRARRCRPDAAQRPDRAHPARRRPRAGGAAPVGCIHSQRPHRRGGSGTGPP